MSPPVTELDKSLRALQTAVSHLAQGELATLAECRLVFERLQTILAQASEGLDYYMISIGHLAHSLSSFGEPLFQELIAPTRQIQVAVQDITDAASALASLAPPAAEPERGSYRSSV